MLRRISVDQGLGVLRCLYVDQGLGVLRGLSVDQGLGMLRCLHVDQGFGTEVPLFSDLPGAPQDLKVSDVTRGTCRLTWKPPQSDGGERVKSYFIERKTVLGKAWTKVL